ncbi:MAG: GDP-mannose 4,6-dehydratase [Acidobacteria bacterium]|nr:GDP-mannose 4,6-dehydratase [Acidobacteriota bacterium]
MRALITGGAGFIGSHLADSLLRNDHEVIVIDDLSTGSMENIEGIRNHVAFAYHIDSIFNRRLLAELVDLADVVFHLAAAVGVRRIVEFPVQTIATNVGGSELVLEMAAKKGKRVLLASTSEVYGKSSQVPFSESGDLVLGSTYHSRWSYACSKAIDEFLALAYYRERKLPVSIVRLFNTVGPRQTGRYGMVIPTFVGQALRGEPLTVFGSGKQTRCFAHVEDVVNGILACVRSNQTAGEIFNLGSMEEITINTLAERVVTACGSHSRIRHIPYEQAYEKGFEDMERRIPDTRKAAECFGYVVTRSLDDIIQSVIEYVRPKLARQAGLSSHVV